MTHTWRLGSGVAALLLICGGATAAWADWPAFHPSAVRVYYPPTPTVTHFSSSAGQYIAPTTGFAPAPTTAFLPAPTTVFHPQSAAPVAMAPVVVAPAAVPVRPLLRPWRTTWHTPPVVGVPTVPAPAVAVPTTTFYAPTQAVFHPSGQTVFYPRGVGF